MVPNLGERLPCASSRRARLVAFAAMAFVPLAFIVATRGNWLLDFGGEDGWIYIKYFMIWGHPHPDLRAFMDTNYKASRVPWILPGYVAYQLFGPLMATYLLHPAVLLASAFCVWLGVRRPFGDGTAIITVLLALAYPGFQSSGITYFWNYHGQAAVGYYLLAMLAVILAASSRHAMLWYALAGAALVATVGTGITHVVLLPAFGVFVLAVQPQLGVRPILLTLLGCTAGVVAGVVVFGLVNVLVGGPFLFFWSQITATREYSDTTQLPFASWFLSWFKGARWTGFPPILAVVSLVALVPLLRWQALGRHRRLVIGCLLQHLVAWAVLIVLEDRGQLIQVAFHYHLIMGPAIFALAALVWVGLRLDRGALSAVTVAVLAGGLVVPQIALDEAARDTLRATLDLSRWLPLPPSDWWAYLMVATVGLSLLLVGVRRRQLAITGAASIILGVSCALNALVASAFQPPDRCNYVTNQYRLILDAVSWSAERQIDTKSLIWFDPATVVDRGPDCPSIPMFPIFDAIQHGTIVKLVAQPVPPRLAEARTDVLNGAIRSRGSVVLLSTPETAADAEAQFQAWLRRASVRSVTTRGPRFAAADGDVAVVLQVFELRRP